MHTKSDPKHFVAVLAATVLLLVAAIPASAADPGEGDAVSGPAIATISANSLNEFKRIVGKVELSEDACGTNAPSCTVEILKPSASATVREADLFCATTGASGYRPQDGEVTVNGSAVNWDAIIPNGISSFNGRDDVTAIVKPVGDAAVAGLVVFTIAENPTLRYDGCILKVIWDDPTTTTNSILIYFGAQETTGDTFVINFAQPLDASSFTAALEFSLGISFGAQGCASGQFSEVDVNGSRLTSSAGGEDDGSCVNGALITVGGTGDTTGNPPPNAPYVTAHVPDDELYDLRPFLAVGDTSMTVFTRNPSNNDNIFIANFFLRNVFVAPPPPARLVLSPKTDTNRAGEEHCVTATVTDAAGDPSVGITVRFSVSGANSASGSVVTDSNGQARFCYTGTIAGTDTITAFADTNRDGVQDPNEPGDTATKVYTAGAPATLTLTPPSDTNTVGDTHCVTATVRDSFGNPVPGVVVTFTVSGANTNGGTRTTDPSGQAQFCYVGTIAGSDVITANAAGLTATAGKTWLAGAPATLVLTPPTATNTVDARHCVTATVRDAFGNPTPGIVVRFSVTGSVTTSGQATTAADGTAQFCYTGPGLPGADVITAFADTNNNGVQNPGEPSGRATKTWVIPASTPGCKVTDGGRITAANGDKATFGSVAKVASDGTPSGAQEYQDHGAAADLNVHSTAVLAVTCSADGKKASVFGTATINGAGSYDYRIDLTDNNEPGVGNDTYRIRLSTGYDSGVQTLIGGNIQLH